jgi:hypothetical protein
MILTCSRGAEQLFTVKDFADYVAASDDGQYTVGLSNRGSENAFWIRNSERNTGGECITARKASRIYANGSTRNIPM